MNRFLAIFPWPGGIALIVLIAWVLARRVSRAAPAPAPSGGIRPASPGARAGTALRAALPAVLRFLVIVAAGTVVVYALMSLLGLVVLHAGPTIDKPIFHWIMSHPSHRWVSAMTRATKVGDTWTVRGAAVAAAVCLAVSWRTLRWLPPLALAAMQVLQRVLTSAIHHTLHRVGPPGHIHGTFPSGGSERCVVFYGLIAYLLWREFSGSRKAAIWSGAAVAALAFNEGYSRLYLGMHWFTDVLSGWIYGGLLLVVFIIAVRMVAGPPRRPGDPGLWDRAAASVSGEGGSRAVSQDAAGNPWGANGPAAEPKVGGRPGTSAMRASDRDPGGRADQPGTAASEFGQ
jgi:membrane-associated phospholipid phosphatase